MEKGVGNSEQGVGSKGVGSIHFERVPCCVCDVRCSDVVTRVLSLGAHLATNHEPCHAIRSDPRTLRPHNAFQFNLVLVSLLSFRLSDMLN